MLRDDVIGSVYQNKIIAIVRGLSQESLLGLGEALLSGGINMMEITFDQKAPDSWRKTADSISLLKNKLGGRMYIGAGTVTSPELVRLAWEAGAEYIISPDTKQEVIEKTRELEMVSMPGAMTPSEITDAYHFGADFVKIFPAGTLGPEYLKSIRAPLSHIPMLAVGGVNIKNLRDFIHAGAAGAGIGGNLVNRDWIQSGKLDKITELANEYTNCVKEG